MFVLIPSAAGTGKRTATTLINKICDTLEIKSVGVWGGVPVPGDAPTIVSAKDVLQRQESDSAHDIANKYTAAYVDLCRNAFSDGARVVTLFAALHTQARRIEIIERVREHCDALMVLTPRTPFLQATFCGIVGEVKQGVDLSAGFEYISKDFGRQEPIVQHQLRRTFGSHRDVVFVRERFGADRTFTFSAFLAAIAEVDGVEIDSASASCATIKYVTRNNSVCRLAVDVDVIRPAQLREFWTSACRQTSRNLGEMPTHGAIDVPPHMESFFATCGEHAIYSDHMVQFEPPLRAKVKLPAMPTYQRTDPCKKRRAMASRKHAVSVSRPALEFLFRM